MKDYGYGLWFLVVFNSLLFIFFAASFFRAWHSSVSVSVRRSWMNAEHPLQVRRSAP